MSEIRSRTIDANGLTFTIDEAGEGPDVALFLHGFPEDRQAWREQLPVLAALGWRAVAPDLRGYGETSRPKGRSAYRIEPLVADVNGLFDALGARRRLLIGHDWGGVIAWQVAIANSPPLDGLVIVNSPHPGVFREVMRRSWRQKLRSWYVGVFQFPWLPEVLMKAGRARAVGQSLQVDARAYPADLAERYRLNALKPGALTAMINYYRANAFALIKPRLGGVMVTTPTLLVWGDADRYLDAALLDGNEAYVPDLTIERLAGVSHWVTHDAPQALSAAITTWLSRRAPASR